MKNFLLSFWFVLTTTPGFATAIHPVVISDLETEEYAVYSATIKKIYLEAVPRKDRIELLVLEDETWLQGSVDQKLTKSLEHLRSQAGTLVAETLNDLRSKNLNPQKLSRMLNLPIEYVLVRKEELKSSFGQGDPNDWSPFYKKYPNSNGLVSISRPGFNSAMNQALVYIQRSCGNMCAVGYLIFLSNDNGAWVVQKQFTLWVT